MADAAFTVGVDAGATRCRARLRDAGGVRLAKTEAGAANIHVDFLAAIAVLRGVIDEVLREAGLGEGDEARIAVGLGLAGFSDANDASRVVEAFPRFARVRAANDATTACIGAHGGADGGLVIAGTGSAAIARAGGAETIVGGRGFALGDDGSGARIGYEALRAATLAYDGLGPETALTGDLIAAFGGDIVALTRWALTAKPGDYGAYAPKVFAHAKANDPVALRIVASAARAIGMLARRAAALGAQRIALAGGVGEALRPYMEPEIDAMLVRPLHDAVDGAILLAGGEIAAG